MKPADQIMNGQHDNQEDTIRTCLAYVLAACVFMILVLGAVSVYRHSMGEINSRVAVSPL